jgi:hypothetical protein
LWPVIFMTSASSNPAARSDVAAVRLVSWKMYPSAPRPAGRFALLHPVAQAFRKSPMQPHAFERFRTGVQVRPWNK